VITLEADFNHVDAHGRLRLDDPRMHERTPFARLAARREEIVFVDGEDMVRGKLVRDPKLGWVGKIDWATQEVWEAYPNAVAGG
jgi:hypothetical protein